MPQAAPLRLEPGQFITAVGLIARWLPADTMWFRLHRTALGPLHFGRPHPGLRFNDAGAGATHPLAPVTVHGAAPDDGGYRVCYVGVSPEAAYVEVFFRRLPSVTVS